MKDCAEDTEGVWEKGGVSAPPLTVSVGLGEGLHGCAWVSSSGLRVTCSATGLELAMLRQQEGQGRIQGGTSGRTRGARCGKVSRLREADQAGVAVQVPGRWRPHSCQPAGRVTAPSGATGGAQAGGPPDLVM